jgi:EpsI family protein
MTVNARFWGMVGVLLAATTGLHLLSHGEAVPPAKPLTDLPVVLGGRSAVDVPMDPRIVRALGVDTYLSRVYLDNAGELGLYVGYYKSQRTGVTIHSPKNCLPGGGWEPIKSGYLDLPGADGRHVTVNQYIIEKGLERRLVLYWYQSHGRIIANEYRGKFYLVLDAIRLNRTDSALVRITTPIRPDEDQARERAVAFAQQVLHELDNLISH